MDTLSCKHLFLTTMPLSIYASEIEKRQKALYAHKWYYIKAYCNAAGSLVFQRLGNKLLAPAGYSSILDQCESLN